MDAKELERCVQRTSDYGELIGVTSKEAGDAMMMLAEVGRNCGGEHDE